MIVPAWPLRILPTSVSGDARPLTYRLRYHRARKDLANITYVALHRSHYLEQPLLDLHLLLVDQPLISVGRDARPLTYRLRYHRPRKDFANITYVALHRSRFLKQPLLDLAHLLVDQPFISVGRDARPLIYRHRYHRPRKDFANITHVAQPRCSTSDLSSAL